MVCEMELIRDIMLIVARVIYFVYVFRAVDNN